MDNQTSKSGYAKVWINSRHIIVCELVGVIDESVTDVSIPLTGEAAKKLMSQGRPVLLLIDTSRITKQTSGARLATKALAKMHIQKIAVCGKDASLILVARYLMYITRAAKLAKAFKTYQRAQDWLSNPISNNFLLRNKNNIAAAIVGFIGASALVGWAIDIKVLTEFTPQVSVVNPVVAISFILLSAALLVVGSGGKNLSPIKKVFVATLACWLLIYSALVWLRVFFAVDLHIDDWLFTDRITQEVRTAPRSAFNFALVSVSLLSLIIEHRKKWEQYVLYVTLLLIFVNSVLMVLGYAFGVGFAEASGFNPMPVTTSVCFAVAAYSMWFLTEPSVRVQKTFAFIDKYQLVGAVFLVMIITTGVAWQRSKVDLASNIDSEIQRVYSKQLNSFNERLTSYTGMLYGFRSLFEASDEVSPQEFEVYFNSSETEKNYPGINGIAFIKRISLEDRQQFEDYMRQQSTDVNPNFANFNIRPETQNSELYVLAYIDPDSVKGAVGYDLGSNEQRRAALDKSRDTGEISTTGTININAALPGDAKEKLGFFSTLPIYSDAEGSALPDTVEERQSRLLGFVNASFVYETLFADVFKDATDENVKFAVKDLVTDTMVYQQDPAIDENNFVYQGNVNANGRIWQLLMYADDTFGSTAPERSVPTIILLGGLALSFLAAFLTLAQTRKRQEALSLAEVMTEDLNEERNGAIAARTKNDIILASIGDAVFAIDKKGKITLFNYAAEAISGYSASEAMGVPYDRILKFRHGNEKNSRVLAGFINRALNGKVAHIEDDAYLIRKDGKKVIVSDSAAPIKDAKGKVTGVVVVFRDATREAELSNAKDEFVSLASHQLRTPLSAINWYAEMLLSGDAGRLTKEQAKYLQEIFNGNQRMIKLVNSLLDVSRIDLGKFVNEPVVTSLEAIIKSLKTELASNIGDKDVKLALRVDKDVPHIKADPKLMRIVMQNLLSNAIKYSKQSGKIEVTVRRATEEDRLGRKCPVNKTCVFISVKDEGIGIPKSQQERIFEKLFRADNAQVQEAEGNGLGLYLTREIVTRLGGTMWFTSEENVGSTFIAIIPLETEATKKKQ